MKLSDLSGNSCQSEELLDSLDVSLAAVETTSVETLQEARTFPALHALQETRLCNCAGGWSVIRRGRAVLETDLRRK